MIQPTGDGIPYTHVVLHLRWLLDATERWLDHLPDATPVTVDRLRTQVPGRVASADEAAAVIAALTGLGIISTGKPARLAQQMLVATAEYRRGVRDMFAALPPPAPSPLLCATIPIGLESGIERTLQQLTRDLRATLVDLVLSARSRIVLAAPFWDSVTAVELADLLDRRLAAGVRVDILARSSTTTGDGYVVLAERLVPRPGLRLFQWYERNNDDMFGTQTFHFKAAVIDGGERAYLGSANMTTGGLRSRMELGLELQGSVATALAHVLDTVLTLAVPKKDGS